MNIIHEPQFDPLQLEMYDLMSDISEGCFCAGWIMGNEYSLWEMIQELDHQDLTAPQTNLQYGMAGVDPVHLRRLQALSEDTGGWIVWMDDQWGPAFISLQDWKEINLRNRRP